MCVTVDMTVEVHIHSVLLSQEFVCPKLSFLPPEVGGPFKVGCVGAGEGLMRG